MKDRSACEAVCKRKNHKTRKGIRLKALLLASALVLIAIAGINATAAFLSAGSNAEVNTFSYGKITCAVTESFDGVTKSNVKIQNTGNTAAYIRSAVVVTWKNEAGDAYWQKPQEGTDYAIAFDCTNGWVKGSDGFYYWRSPVEPQQSTGTLITSCTEMPLKAPDGYTLSVEILADAVQSKPSQAAEQAWGVSILGGQVKIR